MISLTGVVRMNHLEETHYIKRILDGETALFSAFLEQYSHQVFSLIVKIIPCREEAEELTQDTFLKAFRKLDSFKGNSSFSTWLYRIAYNTAISAMRKKKVFYPVFDERQFQNIPDQSVDALLNHEEDESLIGKLEEAVEKLKPEERVVVALYYQEDRSVAEIASVMQITPENVKAKLFRIRKKIYTLVKN